MTATELRRLRRRLGLTQRGLADLVGVPWNTIARWERSEMAMQPSMDRLVRLSVERAAPDAMLPREKKIKGRKPKGGKA